jgi:hypothetical protein
MSFLSNANLTFPTEISNDKKTTHYEEFILFFVQLPEPVPSGKAPRVSGHVPQARVRH